MVMDTKVRAALLGAYSVLLFTSTAYADDPVPKLHSQIFGDWVYRCQDAAAADKSAHAICEVAQEMIVRKDDKTIPVMTMAISKSADLKVTVANIVGPLGVLLKQGLSVAVDQGKPISFEFSYCDQRGCWVSNEKADALVAALKHGKTGHARVVMVNGHSLTIDFSLSGFDPAFAAFDTGKPPVENVAAAAPAKPAAQ